MTPDQLDEQLAKLKKEQFNLRFQRASGQLENTSRVRNVRRDIARIKTVQTQRRRRRGQREGLRLEHAEARFAGRRGLRQEHQDRRGRRWSGATRIRCSRRPCAGRRNSTPTTRTTPSRWATSSHRGEQAHLQEQALGGAEGHQGLSCGLAQAWARLDEHERDDCRTRNWSDDPDGDQPRRGRQLRRAAPAVHQGAGRLEAQVRHDRRHHRRLRSRRRSRAAASRRAR